MTERTCADEVRQPAADLVFQEQSRLLSTGRG